MRRSSCSALSLLRLLLQCFLLHASWGLTACRNNQMTRNGSPSSNIHPVTRRSTTTTATTRLSLAKRRRQYRDEAEGHDELSRQRSTDRPTLRQTQVIGPPIMPSKPKIVVLGASGRIGSLVVRQLLDMKHLDATIIACVRHYDKACKVLYDDLSLVFNNNNNQGPRLRIVEADLVPPEELPGYLDQDEEKWRQRAESAAQFYNTSMSTYDNREETPVIVDANEALQEAIQDCTTIISCVGGVRPTNLWTDFMARPFWRILRPDVSSWCKDSRHPYYVHFASTRKILGYAEREQLRREAAVEMALEEEEETRNEPVIVPKIRYIRVSDNVLSQPAWEMVPLLTNIFRSMVFRYHDMAERLLESSTLIDTVILRPGDLIDEERDVKTTHLQVDPSGEVPTPAVVSRDDVASLAVASALFKSPREQESTNAWNLRSHTNEGGSQTQQHVPFHCSLGVRWVGDMHPYPRQGKKKDGYPTAQISLEKALKAIKSSEKKEKRLEMRRLRSSPSSTGPRGSESYPEIVQRLARNFQLRQQQRRPLKPYGIVSSIPVYIVLALLLRSMGRMLWQALCSEAWAQPVVGPLQEIASMVLAFVVTNISAVRHFLSRSLPRGFGKVFATKQYIKF